MQEGNRYADKAGLHGDGGEVWVNVIQLVQEIRA